MTRIASTGRRPSTALGRLIGALLAGALLITLAPAKAAAVPLGHIEDNAAPGAVLNSPGGASFVRTNPDRTRVNVFQAPGGACPTAPLQNNCVVWNVHDGGMLFASNATQCDPNNVNTAVIVCRTPPTRPVGNTILALHPGLTADMQVRPFTINLAQGSGSAGHEVTIQQLVPVLTSGYIIGSAGDDRIVTRSSSTDIIRLRRGNNRVIADSTTGGLGHNWVIAGTGSDLIQTVDGTPDTVRCKHDRS